MTKKGFIWKEQLGTYLRNNQHNGVDIYHPPLKNGEIIILTSLLYHRVVI